MQTKQINLTQAQLDTLHVMLQNHIDKVQPSTQQLKDLQEISHILHPVNWNVCIAVESGELPYVKQYIVEASNKTEAQMKASSLYLAQFPDIDKTEMQYIDTYLLSEDMPF